MRKYKENRKSVKAKTYKDYLAARQQYIDKGFNVRSALSKEAFEQVYTALRMARNTGELKTSAWDHLMKHQRYVVSGKQARNFQKAYKMVYGRGITLSGVYKLDTKTIQELSEYIDEHKEEGIFGGDYE